MLVSKWNVGTNSSILWDETANLWKIFNGQGSTTVSIPAKTGTVALTSDLHTRSHTMTSTSDHTAGNWKAFLFKWIWTSY